jgi:GDP-L-fucose synthase
VKLLITGARGMVGQNLLEHAGLVGHEVLKPSRSELDLNSYKAVKDYLSEHRPDIIVHTAGKVGGIQANIKNPVEFLVENLDINRNLIGASYEVGIKKILNLGSSCMYPRNAENPLKESMILQGELEPTNEGYALAKVTAQRLCEYIMKEDSSFLYKTFIPCNLFGRHDKFSPEHSHLVPAAIRKVHEAKINGYSEVEIWGDGEARREFMYAGDLADCIVRGLKEFSTLPDLMNVGLGRDYTVNEYYENVAQVVGYKGKFIHNLSQPVGMKRKLVSIEKLDQWGWKSQTSLREGIEKAYQYFLSLKS